MVDGNDVISVEKTTSELIDYIKKGNGPCYLEGVTYRWLGHVDWRDDIDVGVSRSKEDIENWKKRDPEDRLSKQMLIENVIDQNELIKLKEDLEIFVLNSWEKSLNDPYPDKNDLLKNVYA